jgi:diguanylate cyclase (GGDEF)-like protein
MGMAVQFFPTDVFSQHGLYLKLLLLPGALALLAALLLPQHPRLARHFEIIISVAGGLLLFLLLLAVFCAVTLDFAFHGSVNVNMMIMLTAFASRIRVTAFILMVIGASGLAVLTGLWIDAHIDWLKMGHFLLLYCTVVLFVMSLIEAKDRLSFLQTLMLSQQANQLDVLNQQLIRVAREDVLSGLPNRQAFDELFHREWERTRRDAQPLALVYIDLDYFKLYNDNYGHLAGDTALQEIAAVLRDALLRPADQACRYGGEAFMLLLPNTTLQGATEVAKRVIEQVDRLAIEHRWSQVAAHLTVSAGIATSIEEDTSELQFLRRVDNALYLAKRDGRHRFFVDTYSC